MRVNLTPKRTVGCECVSFFYERTINGCTQCYIEKMLYKSGGCGGVAFYSLGFFHLFCVVYIHALNFFVGLPSSIVKLYNFNLENLLSQI